MFLEPKIRHELFVRRWNMGGDGWVSLKELYMLVPKYPIKDVRETINRMCRNPRTQIEKSKNFLCPKYRHKQGIAPHLQNEREWRSMLRSWIKNRIGNE